MGRIVPTILDLGDGAKRLKWAGVAGGDICEPVSLVSRRDKTVGVYGTVTTFALQGTNDDDPTANLATLYDVDGTTLLNATAFASDALHVLKENPQFIVPLLTTGAGVDVIIVAR